MATVICVVEIFGLDLLVMIVDVEAQTARRRGGAEFVEIGGGGQRVLQAADARIAEPGRADMALAQRHRFVQNRVPALGLERAVAGELMDAILGQQRLVGGKGQGQPVAQAFHVAKTDGVHFRVRRVHGCGRDGNGTARHRRWHVLLGDHRAQHVVELKADLAVRDGRAGGIRVRARKQKRQRAAKAKFADHVSPRFYSQRRTRFL